MFSASGGGGLPISGPAELVVLVLLILIGAMFVLWKMLD